MSFGNDRPAKIDGAKRSVSIYKLEVLSATIEDGWRIRDRKLGNICACSWMRCLKFGKGVTSLPFYMVNERLCRLHQVRKWNGEH